MQPVYVLCCRLPIVSMADYDADAFASSPIPSPPSLSPSVQAAATLNAAALLASLEKDEYGEDFDIPTVDDDGYDSDGFDSAPTSKRASGVVTTPSVPAATIPTAVPIATPVVAPVKPARPPSAHPNRPPSAVRSRPTTAARVRSLSQQVPQLDASYSGEEFDDVKAKPKPKQARPTSADDTPVHYQDAMPVAAEASTPAPTVASATPVKSAIAAPTPAKPVAPAPAAAPAKATTVPAAATITTPSKRTVAPAAPSTAPKAAANPTSPAAVKSPPPAAKPATTVASPTVAKPVAPITPAKPVAPPPATKALASPPATAKPASAIPAKIASPPAKAAPAPAPAPVKAVPVPVLSATQPAPPAAAASDDYADDFSEHTPAISRKASANEYGDEEFGDSAKPAAKPITAVPTKVKSAIAPPPMSPRSPPPAVASPKVAARSPVTSPRRPASRSSSPSKSAVVGDAASRAVPSTKKSTPLPTKSSSHKKKPSPPAEDESAAKSTPKAGAAYDAARRTAQRAQRQALEQKKLQETMEREHRTGKMEEEKERRDVEKRLAQEDAELIAAGKTPNQPPPADAATAKKTMSDADFLNSIFGPATPKRTRSVVPASGSTKKAKKAASSPTRKPSASPPRSRPQTSRPAAPKSPHIIHPTPWAPVVRPQTAGAAHAHQEEKSADLDPPPDLDATDPIAVYAFNDARNGFVASPSPRSASSARPRPPSAGPTYHSSTSAYSAGHTGRSRAANAWARHRIAAELQLGKGGRVGGKGSVRPQTASVYQARLDSPTRPPSAVHPASAHVSDILASRQHALSLEARRIVSRAANVLRDVASDVPMSQDDSPPPPLPLNSTAPPAHIGPGGVPRCAPRALVKQRVAQARFRRDHVFPSPNGPAWGRKENAAGAHIGENWDVSLQLQYGHSVVAGLKARTANLASTLSSQGLNAPADPAAEYVTSGGTSDQERLFQSVRVTQSLESYYSLLGQLDFHVKKQKDDFRGGLHQILFQPTVPGGRSATSLPHSSQPQAYSFRPTNELNESSGEPWVHSNTALPIRSATARPMSGRRDHPNGAKTRVPDYDALLDPHVGSVLTKERAKTIRQTRADELRNEPVLDTLLDARVQSHSNELAAMEAHDSQERARKLRQDQPDSLARRPPSAKSPAGSKSTTGMKKRLSMVNSVYSQGNGTSRPSSSAPQRRGASAVQRALAAYPRVVYTSTAPQAPQSPSKRAGQAATSHDYLDGLSAGIAVRDEDENAEADAATDDFDVEVEAAEDGHEAPTPRRLPTSPSKVRPSSSHPSSSPLSVEPDWHALTAAWPAEPSQLTNDLEKLGLLHQVEDAKEARGMEADGPTRLVADYNIAERCLKELHSQLGVKYTTPPSKFTAVRPPTPEQVADLKYLCRSLVDCRDLIIRIVQAIDEREQAMAKITAEGDAPTSASISALSARDHALLILLRSFSSSFRTAFPSSSLFASGRFCWRGLDLAELVLREKATILRTVHGMPPTPGVRGVSARIARPASSRPLTAKAASSNPEAAIEQLATMYRGERTPKEIASAAAAIVLGTLTQQAQAMQRTHRF